MLAILDLLLDHVSQTPPPVSLLKHMSGFGRSKMAQLVQGVNDFSPLVHFSNRLACLQVNQTVIYVGISAIFAPDPCLLGF